jgi:hypothetical protein
MSAIGGPPMAELVLINPESVPVPRKFFVLNCNLRPVRFRITAMIIIVANKSER